MLSLGANSTGTVRRKWVTIQHLCLSFVFKFNMPMSTTLSLLTVNLRVSGVLHIHHRLALRVENLGWRKGQRWDVLVVCSAVRGLLSLPWFTA